MRTEDFAQVALDGRDFVLVVPGQEDSPIIADSIAHVLAVMADGGWEYIGSPSPVHHLFKRRRTDVSMGDLPCYHQTFRAGLRAMWELRKKVAPPEQFLFELL